MRRLTVLYDSRCGFCGRCRQWLEGQRKLLEMELIPAGTMHARSRFPTLAAADTTEELVVVDDEGGVYRGSDAWILCLYALEDYREWSVRLARPSLRPLARGAFEWLSRHRFAISRQLGLVPDEEVAARFRPQAERSCGIDPGPLRGGRKP